MELAIEACRSPIPPMVNYLWSKMTERLVDEVGKVYDFYRQVF